MNPLTVPNTIQTLCIVSHVTHYSDGDSLFAYGPYAREIDIWADLFAHVWIAAPLRNERPPGDTTAFTRANITVLAQLETGGEDWRAKLAQIVRLPWLITSLGSAMSRADAIHVRCPGNLGLLGALMARYYSPRRIAKYAGQWQGYPGEPRSFRLQRAILRSWWWGAPVTVYGDWPQQSGQVIPFFTSVLEDEQMAQAQLVANARTTQPRSKILFVGRLSVAKNVSTLLNAVARLVDDGLDVTCKVVGDGPESTRLCDLANELALGDRIHFTGGVDFEQVLSYYAASDVLVLASETEGWPKAITEAMAFGLVCIGADRGLVPEILGEGRGLVVPPGDVDALTAALRLVVESPEEAAAMGARAADWSQQFTLERLRDALRDLLVAHWHVDLPTPDASLDEETAVEW